MKHLSLRTAWFLNIQTNISGFNIFYSKTGCIKSYLIYSFLCVSSNQTLKVLSFGMTLIYIWWWGTSCGDLGSVEYLPSLSLLSGPLWPRVVCDGKLTKIPKTGLYFRTCEDGAGWHLIPYRISPRPEFFSQAYKTWHITWGINLGPDQPPLARGSKFHTIHTPTRPLNFIP